MSYVDVQDPPATRWVSVMILVALFAGIAKCAITDPTPNIRQEQRAWMEANDCKRTGYLAERTGTKEVFTCANGVAYTWDDLPRLTN